MRTAKKEFKEEVLKVIDESEKSVIRVVRWGKGSPVLAKQQKFETADGEVRTGKVKGLNFDDLQTIKENLDEIEELLGG